MRNMGGEGWIDFVYNLNRRLWSVDPQHFDSTLRECLDYVKEMNDDGDIYYDDLGNERIHDLGGLKACIGLVRKDWSTNSEGSSSEDSRLEARDGEFSRHSTRPNAIQLAKAFTSAAHDVFGTSGGGSSDNRSFSGCTLWLLLVDAAQWESLGLHRHVFEKSAFDRDREQVRRLYTMHVFLSLRTVLSHPRIPPSSHYTYSDAACTTKKGAGRVRWTAASRGVVIPSTPTRCAFSSIGQMNIRSRHRT